jgi:glycosyltransferase involved in cell wall biosynthesis
MLCHYSSVLRLFLSEAGEAVSGSMHNYTISFIIPALNEERVLETVIEQVMEKIAAARFPDYEVILVDDGSTDRTGEIMEAAARRHSKMQVLHNARNLRFGNSYKRGLREARFDYVMLLCGDGGLPASSLPPIFECIGTADIVVPWMTNLKVIKSPWRYFLSRAYTAMLNLTFGMRLKYYNGLPVHRRDLLQSIDITSGGFGFQSEILIKLIRSGCSFVQVGVQGAEEKGGSFAMRPRNWISVARTFAHLVLELIRFKRVPAEVIAHRPQPASKEAAAPAEAQIPGVVR